ncbi:MAG: hypothetical protein ISR64_08970 [Deltaproteobacteria bacterium]|nr:hypothetical protein [Deltaproteobacteria bacterium]
MRKISSGPHRAVLNFIALACLTGLPVSVGAEGLPGVTGRDKLYDVEVAGNHAWIVGFPGIILHSGDRGRTFERQGPGGTTAWLAVDFTDERHGVVVGRGGNALVTGDGGKTWTAHEMGTREPLFDLSCPDATRCYAVGNFAAALKSEDGGRTWTPMNVVPEGEDPSLNGVHFADVNTGYAVGEFGLVARTTDAGASWERVDDGMNADNNFGVAAQKDGSVVVVGSYGLVQVGRVVPVKNEGESTDPDTVDGGQKTVDTEMTFTTLPTGIKEHLFRVTGTLGGLIASGEAGALLTAPGVKGPWTVASTPTFQWLAMAQVDDKGHGFALGGHGTLLFTADGGKTWKKWRAQ